MSFDWEQPEDFGGGNFLKVGGTFHVLVLGISTENEDGTLLKNGGFRVNFEVVDGTERDKSGCTETKKTFNLFFNDGKLSHADGGRFKRQCQAAFFVAANVLGPSDIPAILARKPKIDLDRANSQQLVLTLEKKPEDRYLNLVGADIYHIDDPAAKAFPKDAACLDLIPKANRRTPEELQAIKDAFGGKAPGSNGANGSQAKRPAPPAVNLDEI